VSSAALEPLLRGVRPESLLAAMAALAGLTLLAGYLYVLRPSIQSLAALESGDSRATLDSLQLEFAENAAAITTSEAELTTLRSRLFAGPADLPPEKAESYIVDRLNRISGNHAIALLSVRPGEAKRVLMFDELLYEVEVEGEFFSLVAWLRELEQELRPLVVNEFDMKPQARGARVGMKLRLASYRPRDGVS
jgi:Tfp pilus assembly protein PilO